VKKLLGPFAVLSMLAALLLGTTATAGATGSKPDDVNCVQVGLINICDIDIDLLVLEDPDIVVEIEDVLNDNEINILENALKDADILNGGVINVILIKTVIADVLDIDVSKITVILCALQVHAHCH
jgi:hypothetical protein